MLLFTIIDLCLSTIITSFLTCRFLILFLGLENKRGYYFIYVFINFILQYVSLKIELPISIYFEILNSVIIIYLFCRYVLKVESKTSFVMGWFTTSIWASLNVFTFSISSILFRKTSINPMILFALLSIGSSILLGITYDMFQRRYGMNGKYREQYISIIIVPISFVSVALHTVMNALYQTVVVNKNRMIGNTSLQQDFEILVLSLVAISCIYIVLYTYEKVINQIETKNNLIKLECENLLQRKYIFEAKNKYHSTQAFRHDFKNHIMTLKGLLNKNKIVMAKEYLKRFEEISQTISFDIFTNNHIIDILLGEKLTLANKMNIYVTCDIEIEKKIQIDDFDLCSIFSNLVDNAIKACMDVSDTDKFIDIVAKSKKDFFIIDIMNSYNPEKYRKGDGIGLETIKLLIDKYGGIMEKEEKNSVFRLSILFILN